jgi:hypothetical protein
MRRRHPVHFCSGDGAADTVKWLAAGKKAEVQIPTWPQIFLCYMQAGSEARPILYVS